MDKYSLFLKLLEITKARIEDTKKDIQKTQETANSHKGAMASRYDTFKEEAQYLVSGLYNRLGNLQQSERKLKELLSELKSSFSSNQISVSSLIRIENEQGEILIFLFSPVLGGEKVSHCNETITVITKDSPLGRSLFGREVGDEIYFKGKEFYIEEIK